MHFKKLVNDILATGVTQQELAAMCGCCQNAIGKIALGRTTDPHWSTVSSLLNAACKHRVAIDWGGLEPAIRFSLRQKSKVDRFQRRAAKIE